MYFNCPVLKHTDVTQYLRLYRFYNCLQYALEKERITDLHPKEEIIKKNNSHKKKRNREKACGKCVTKDNDKELENDDDPGVNVAIFPEDY